MSENPEPTLKTRTNRHRAKRRFTRTRLPTPPPDPTLPEEADSPVSQDKDAQFFEYINSLQKIPQLSPIMVTEDAFDHLDKLYKLMEQMLNLRQQNAKLQRKIRDLEHLKTLHSLNFNLDNTPHFEDIPELDDDSLFAESLLDTILMGTKKDVKPKPWMRSRLRQSLLKKQRYRSSSVNEKVTSVDFDDSQDRRTSSGGSDRDKPSKVSKWTKVKAAFRWEKASPSVSGAKSQDSGIGGMLPLNYEVARYLRVPSNSDETGISPADSGAADGSTPGSLSSASSTDDIHRSDLRRELQTSDDDHHSIILDEDQLTRQGSSNSNKGKLQSNTNYKKHFRSDDIKLYISDNDELETEYDDTSKLTKNVDKKIEKREIPANILERYRRVVAEDEYINKQNLPKRVSKWTRVKKAFLTPSLSISIDDKYKTGHSHVPYLSRSYKDIHLYKPDDESKQTQYEIQKNYRQLQKQLSIEFQNKLHEWEKLKSLGSTNTAGIRSDGTADDHKDQAFIKKMEEWQRIKSQPSKVGQNLQMVREENLAPEFKKKLEEWQKIKRYAVKDDNVQLNKPKKKLGEWPKWKSISGHRDEHASTEQQPLSDDFLKKLEEWRKIKESSKHDDVDEKRSSPKLMRQDGDEPTTSGYNRKHKESEPNQKELQWFEKELHKIEKEKQRLEQERQKFLQREERLAKLRRTVMGNGNKKDILIHTPSGFYRFEGISRKFTQKLCEWEKAQGIGPEASTFALLTSTFTPHVRVDLYEANRPVEETPYNSSRLLRSKSAESISNNNLVPTCSPNSHHPSSLSLNDVEELEKQCMSLSRESSIRDFEDSLEKYGNDEPEAVIVEVEDVEEETAELLEECLEEKHFPVYQREKELNTCQEQPSVIPFVQRSDSKSVQYSSFLIEEIIKVLKTIEECEENREAETQNLNIKNEGENEVSLMDKIIEKDNNESQKQRSDIVLEKLIQLQEMHSKTISDVAVKDDAPSSTHFANLSDAVQDLFSDLFQMAEQLQNTLYGRNIKNYCEDLPYSNVTAVTSEFTPKFYELKRILTYFYAASDMNAPSRKFKSIRKPKKDVTSTDTEQEEETKIDILNNIQNQSEDERLLLKRMRYKNRNYCNKILCESEESDVNEIEETKETITVDPVIIERLVIPTKTKILNINNAPKCVTPSSPVEIFVKTTRKLFTPLVMDETAQNTSTSRNDLSSQSIAARLPPLPASPTPQRKASKEISPSIRIMLAKYNQMISQQDFPGAPKSAGSSGSASPIAWRSPISERRVQVQKQRYLEEIKKIGEVKKSASISALNYIKQPDVMSPRLSNIDNSRTAKGILRSTSASVLQTDKFEPKSALRLIIPKNSEESNIRYQKLLKAKETFLNSPGTPNSVPSSAPPFLVTHSPTNYPTRTRFSQISMGSESSCDSSPCEGMLVKSASAGMINVDEITYKQIDPAFHQDGYVSLPRSVSKQKEGLLGGKLSLSNIAAKFRKVKMRRNKDPKKMNTVSALCRQSLVVDINSQAQEAEKQGRRDSLTVPLDRGASSSEDTSPSSSRSGSWIRRSRIFKAL